MSQLDDEALASFNEVFEQPAAPDEGPPADEPTDDAPSEPEATADPEPDDEQPRDEHGRFAPKEKYAGKYASVEDLEKAYLEAQKALGSYKGEVGELRQTLEERLDAIQKQQPQPVFDHEVIERNPGAVAQQIAVQMFNNGQDPETHPAYEAVMEEWYDQAPREATKFERTLDRVRFQASLEQVTQPVQQTLAEQQNQMALQSFVRDNPDLPDYLTEIQQIAAEPGNEVLSQALLSEDPKSRVSALGVLYRLAKATAPARATPQQATESARATAAEVEKAVQEAAVVNTANANQGDAPVLDEVDRMWEAWQTLGVSHLK